MGDLLHHNHPDLPLNEQIDQATVPGDLITDLEQAGFIGDPLYDNNHLTFNQPPYDAAQWAGQRWVYSKQFRLSSELSLASSDDILLVFDGVKMGAAIYFNDRQIGQTTNQHRRYIFSVKDYLSSDQQNLTVVFDRSISTLGGRFMACSGGWDWAPYSRLRDIDGNPMFTRGIWKSVYLAPISCTSITGFVPTVFYNESDWPTLPMKDGTNNWFVNATVHFQTTRPVTGTLTIEGEWGTKSEVTVHLTPGVSSHTLIVPASKVDLWWPRGLGAQKRYTISATFVSTAPQCQLETSRQIGFRLAALVTVRQFSVS